MSVRRQVPDGGAIDTCLKSGPEREGTHIERALSLLYAASAIIEDILAGILILAVPPCLALWEALRLKDRIQSTRDTRVL